MLAPKMVPPPTRGKASSVTKVTRDWYPVCRSKALGKSPMAVKLLGVPLAIFRTSGGVGALLDRCAHRNVPLSLGKVRGDRIECGYHGWQFDICGGCRHIPCLVGDTDKRSRKVDAYPAVEKHGFVWVFGDAETPPDREPFGFPCMDDARYSHAGADILLEGTVHAAAENALDVPHTAYLHGGLFRKPGPGRPIDVVIRRWDEGCEAEYIGEAAPPGVVGKLLAPGGGTVEHFDRFLLPSITQVEYRLGDAHLVISSALTPISDFETMLFGQVAFRLPIKLPSRVIESVLRPLALVILKQDATMLRHQTKSVKRFGGEQLVSTDVDVLGPHILRLLKDAELGKRGPQRAELGARGELSLEKKMSMRV